MNTSKLVLLFDYLNSIGKVGFINKKLVKSFLKEDALELRLWSHIKKCSKLKNQKKLKLQRNYVIENLFNGDAKSLNRTASRLYKRIKSILTNEFIQDKPLIEDWLYRETLKEKPNRISQLITEGIIANKYESATSFEKNLNSYIQFHVTYEKYLEDSLQNFADASLFVKARQDLENYYIKYHSILETEKQQRESVKTNENIKILQKPVLDKNQSLLESELLLQKANSLNDNPQYFSFCLNWLIHLVEENLISKEMQKTIFPILYNFSLRNYTKEKQSLQQKYIDKIIYLALDNKVLYTEGKLSAFIYVNLLSAISVNSIKTKNYVKRYLKEVDPQEYSKANYISKLYVAFYNNQFEEVLNIINKNEDNVSLGFDTSLKSKVRLFLIRAYFELRDEENFIKQYAGTKRYYKSQNLSKQKEISLINALEYMKEFFYIENSESLLILESKVQNKDIALKTWLMKKIKESPFYTKG